MAGRSSELWENRSGGSTSPERLLLGRIVRRGGSGQASSLARRLMNQINDRMGMFGEDKTDSDALETVDSDSGEARASSNPPRTATGGGLLITAGVLLVIGGGALAAAPTLVPQYAWAVRSAAQYGVTFGLLALSGIVLVGLGRVVRQVNQATAATEQNSSDDIQMLEHLVLDFTKLRDGVQDLRQELAQVREASTTILQTAVGLSEAQNAEGRQDAIFRMAASLDQVGARIEHRLGAQGTALQDTLAELSNAILATHTLVAEIASSPSPTPTQAHESVREPRARTQQRSTDSSTLAPGSELDVWVELDVDEPRSLGLLDTLDDIGQTQSKKTSLSLERPRGQDTGGQQQPGPLPKIIRNQPAGAALLGRDAGDGVRSIPRETPNREAPIGEKIDQLKSLLSDARVRQALELMQGDGRNNT